MWLLPWRTNKTVPEKKPIRFPLGLCACTLVRRETVVLFSAMLLSAMLMADNLVIGGIATLGCTAMLLALWVTPWLNRVCMDAEEIRVERFGKTIQRIPVSRLQCICVAGTDSADILCFSARTPEELAKRNPKKVWGHPSRKALANQYLLWLASKGSFRSRDPEVIWLAMGNGARLAARWLYPQLPIQYWGAPPDIPTDGEVVSWSPYPMRIQPDGIWVRIQDDWQLQMPAAEIRSIARYDHYGVGKAYLHHHIYLIVSTEDVEALAVQAKNIPDWMDDLPTAKRLRAAVVLAGKPRFWKPERREYVRISLVPGRDAQLKKFYPNAQWVDLETCCVKNEVI